MTVAFRFRPDMLDFTVIVVTHNRVAALRDTLAALARLSYRGHWEVLVVDNNSTDATRELVMRTQSDFPVRLRYLFEGTPGKYWALNAGIRATDTAYLAATDDDAAPEPDWLDCAAAGFTEFGCDFVGGPVYPRWQATPPVWVDARDSITGKVLGLQDHGPLPLEYGRDGLSWPIGVNVAYRRDAFARAGPFDGRLGRVAGTLRNQSQREWHLRARAAGLTGRYLPRMVVHHCVEAERLTRSYFLRWFYWHGISRAILYETRGLHLLETDGDASHRHELHVLGVPMSLLRQGARACLGTAKRWVLGPRERSVEHEMVVCFCAGVIRQRLRDVGKRRRHQLHQHASAAITPPAVGKSRVEQR